MLPKLKSVTSDQSEENHVFAENGVFNWLQIKFRASARKKKSSSNSFLPINNQKLKRKVDRNSGEIEAKKSFGKKWSKWCHTRWEFQRFSSWILNSHRVQFFTLRQIVFRRGSAISKVYNIWSISSFDRFWSTLGFLQFFLVWSNSIFA